ncbi:MAG: SDR family NAD(P)-dependent oxidoreductase, partial [Elusimicrobia bacterium]|nr:SDR family NAD(P)-dependent oxidoreductase [Elusimicrobiota bacterium]
ALRLGAGFGSQIAITLLRRGWKVGEPRIHDAGRHQAWLREITGEADPELEVVHNTLRVKDTGSKRARPSTGSDDETPATAPARPAPAPRREPAPAASTAVHAVATAAPPKRDEAVVAKEVVALVSEKTGYPAEMLELDLDMEADLGIDTVKQAELIGILRERYAIAKQENLSLKDYPTLRHVIRFVMKGGGGGAAPLAPSGNGALKDSPGPSGPGANGHHAGPVVPPPAMPEAPAPAPVPAPEPQVAPSGGLDEETVRKEVVALVSEKTGYPPEMLELDLDMEADLGIDTVKQAELIGILREKYSIGKQENLSLKDYPTLRHVIGFVMKSGGGAAAPATAEVVPTKTSSSADFKRWALVEYPRPASGSWSLPESGIAVVAAGAADAKPFIAALKKAGRTAVFVPAQDSPEAAGKAFAKALGKESLSGIVYLPGLGVGSFKKTATPSAFDKAYREAVVPLFSAAKAVGCGKFLVTVSRGGAEHPLAGAVAGLAKALRRELPGVRVQTLSFSAPANVAEKTVAELQAADGAAEVRFEGNKRLAVRLAAEPAGDANLELDSSSVVVVTGGGQGLGAECAKEIARRWKPRLFVLGRTTLGKDASKWAAMSAAELKELKNELWNKLKAGVKVRATPALLEKEFSKVAKAAELQRNLDAMKAAGARVEYLSADLADPKAVAAAAKELGAPDLVLHAAGLEESKLLADKTPERFDAIFKAKAHGAFHLLQSLKAKKGQRWVQFSSVVGRFGNVGQTDYAAASDFLAGLSGWLREQGTPSVTIDLTAIAEIGMATRGGVEQFLKSQGVDFMPPRVAVDLILAEAVGPMKDAEVVLAGSLGKLDSDGLMSGPVSSGATHPMRLPAEKAEERALPKGRTLLDSFHDGVGAREFSLEKDPWLADHSIAGTPYVAGVMGLELFAVTHAKLQGKLPAGFQDVRFALPIKLLRNKPISVRVKSAGDGLLIESDFVTPQGLKLGGPRAHFTAKPVEGVAPSWQGPKPQLKAGKFEVEPAEIYSAYFHGPSFQVLEGFLSVSENEALAVYKRPSKALWPAGAPSLVFAPLLIEAAFQACGFRDLKYTKKMTLPDSIGRVLVQPRAHEAPDRLYVHVAYKGPDGDQKSVYDATVFDERHRVWVRLEDYRMIAVS